MRCLAAVGPLATAQLEAAAQEYRHRRTEHAGDPAEDLLELLQRSEAVRYDDTSDRWTLTTPRRPFGRDQELLTAIRDLGEVFSHTDYRQAVEVAGFTSSYRVPWIVHVDRARGRYATVDRLDAALRHRRAPAKRRGRQG